MGFGKRGSLADGLPCLAYLIDSTRSPCRVTASVTLLQLQSGSTDAKIFRDQLGAGPWSCTAGLLGRCVVNTAAKCTAQFPKWKYCIRDRTLPNSRYAARS
jgi:hypothetical protein